MIKKLIETGKKLIKKLLETSKKLSLPSRELQTTLNSTKEDQELELSKRKICSQKQSRAKSSIFIEDFLIILSHVYSKVRYTMCRDMIAHAVLKYTGIRISNLRHVTLAHLHNFFGYKTMIITAIKSKSKKPLIIPVVDAGKNVIEPVRPYYLELLGILDNKDPNIIKEAYSNPPYESELWGQNLPKGKGISREHLTRRLNNQLKSAGLDLNKQITSHSYRRGYAIAVGKLKGIIVARKILNHTNIASTQDYYLDYIDKQQELSLTELVDIYDSISKISHSNELEYMSFYKLQIEIDEILEDE